MATPYEYVRLTSAASTQDEARARLGDRPQLVVADRQVSGRGRTGRTWVEAPRAVFASLALRTPWPPRSWPLLTLAAGLAARTVLGDDVGLKWPNDLVTAAGKVGGLLAEAETEGVVIGLGVNLWWPAPRPGAAAVMADDPGEREAPRIARRWATRMLGRLRRGPDDWGADEYRAACITLGTEIGWAGPAAGTGRAEDITAQGALVVATASGTIHLTSGEVHSLRPLR